MNLTDHLADYGFHSANHAWQQYVFPGGGSANVCLSETPFTFDVEVDRGDGGMDTYTAQTTEQVMARLAELAGQPAREENAA